MAFNYNCTCNPVISIDVWTVSLEDGAEINDREVTLIWNYYYGGSNDLRHDILVGTSPDVFEHVETNYNTDDTTYTLTSLEPLTN